MENNVFQRKKCRTDRESVLKILWIVESIAPLLYHTQRKSASSVDNM